MGEIFPYKIKPGLDVGSIWLIFLQTKSNWTNGRNQTKMDWPLKLLFGWFIILLF